jgi:arginyl-tRNA synthetase
MKQTIQQLLQTSLSALQQQGVVPEDVKVDIQLDHTKDKSHGDFSTNLALMLAKPCQQKPRDIAQQLCEQLPADPGIEKVEIAGPGFINFFVAEGTQAQVVAQILEEKEHFGTCNIGQGTRIFLEFVSANPTGPLHVGHGRGAAFGASLANVLKATGYDVHSEYYVNDAGRQMNILAVSVWLRYLALHGLKFAFPSNGYRGDYVTEMAETLQKQVDDRFVHELKPVFTNVPADEKDGVGDKEAHIDGLIKNCKVLLGENDYNTLFDLGLNTLVDDIREDLKEFGVEFDEWFSEKHLVTENAVEHALKVLHKANVLYEKEGALWFKSTELGDDKDRVVRRKNGDTTYFASDIAYMLNKFERGAQQLVYIFGADHHGYIPRLRASVAALGHSNDDVLFEIVQFAVLYRGEEQVKMSTRRGEFVTLRELRKEVGNDAARFFYIMRKADQHMDFDLELAKSQSNDNPVFYIQYAHARICSVFKQLEEKGFTYDQAQGVSNLALLAEEHEQALIRLLSRYAETLASAARAKEPHRIAVYLRELANALHSYYNAHIFLVEDEPLRNARLALCAATRRVLANATQLLGVSAPTSM